MLEPTDRLEDESLAARIQSILINAAEGQRSVFDDREYTTLRRQFLARFKSSVPLVATHPTVDSYVAFARSTMSKPDRVARIRHEFEQLLNSFAGAPTSAASSTWTGIKSRRDRLTATKTLIPLAQAAIEGMISSLSTPGANGGPILNERQEAIDNLRKLHSALGDLLTSIDRGNFEDEHGDELAAQAARYVKRVARSLRDDPMPYISSTMLYGILAICGFPGLGGHLGGIALNIRRNAGAEGN